MKKITRIVLGLLVIALLVSACSSSKSDFYKIAEQVKESDEDFSNYKGIFADYKGGNDVTEFKDSPEMQYQSAEIPLIKINDLYATVYISNAYDDIRPSNGINLDFYTKDNDMTLDELEETILGLLKKDFPKIRFADVILDGEVHKFYLYNDEKDDFSASMHRYEDGDESKTDGYISVSLDKSSYNPDNDPEYSAETEE